MVTRKPQIVGKPFPRVEAALKVTGASYYIGDRDFGSDELHAGLLLSSRAHAEILSIDVRKAKKLPGVLLVLTGDEVPTQLGMQLADKPILARDRVRYVGEPVVAVVAESLLIAEQACELIDIKYGNLPILGDIEDSMAPGAALIHPELPSYRQEESLSLGENNQNVHYCFEQGDIRKGWSEADVVLEKTYRVGRMQHVSMEPHGCVARQDAEGQVTLWASTQAPFVQRQMISEALALDANALRVIPAWVGGGFGGKVYAGIEAIVVKLAMELPGRPVRLMFSRTEEFTSTCLRPGLKARVKMGVKADGHLTAIDVSYFWNTGAVADPVINIIKAATYAGSGPYQVEHRRIESYGLYTNQPGACPVRGNSMSEVHWAIEQHIDRMAKAIDMDPLQFRLLNFIKGGDALLDERTMHASGLDQCMRQVAEAIEWTDTTASITGDGVLRGKGLAAMWNPVTTTSENESHAEVILDADNICSLRIGGVDTGQGTYTLAVQLVASEVGIPLDWVRLMPVNTGESPAAERSVSSNLTWSVGNAVLRAAADAKTQVLNFVATAWVEPVGNIDIIDGELVSYATEKHLSLKTFLSEGINENGETYRPQPILGQGSFTAPAWLQADDDDEETLPVVHFGTGAQAVEVEVDAETGQIKILQIAAAFDVGHAINPDIVKAQIKGGVMQGVSATLLEELIYEDGVPQNPRLGDYAIATFRDLPATMEAIVVEIPQIDGPFGARGVGELAMIPTSPAIANAIFRASGLRVEEMPITAERLWRAQKA